MRLFTSALLTETNTFSDFATTLASFQELGVRVGNVRQDELGSVGPVIHKWHQLASEHGDGVEQGLYAIAQPAGPVRAHDYQTLKGELLRCVQRSLPLDVVLLFLHGAMVADGTEDCEGDLTQAVRSLVGERCVIGLELDPHCHLTEAMTEAADAIVLMREYPHTDYLERAAELFKICRDAASSRVRPVMSVVDCRMVGFYPTTAQPMRGLVDRLAEVERRDGILSASYVHGFPWGDVRDAGTKALVVANDDAKLAEQTATELARALYQCRQALLPRPESVKEALQRVSASGPALVLADSSDNPGGGAPCDHTVMLAALLDMPLYRSACGMLWDPESVQACFEAGIGMPVRLRVGGKAGPGSGSSVRVEGHVLGLSEQHTQTVGGLTDPLGRAAWVRAGLVDLVLISRRQQTLSPTGFTNLGVPLHEARVIGVKSSHHYYAEFSALSPNCQLVDTGAVLSMDFAALAYRHRHMDFYPAKYDPAPHLG